MSRSAAGTPQCLHLGTVRSCKWTEKRSPVAVRASRTRFFTKTYLHFYHDLVDSAFLSRESKNVLFNCKVLIDFKVSCKLCVLQHVVPSGSSCGASYLSHKSSGILSTFPWHWEPANWFCRYNSPAVHKTKTVSKQSMTSIEVFSVFAFCGQFKVLSLWLQRSKHKVLRKCMSLQFYRTFQWQ